MQQSGINMEKAKINNRVSITRLINRKGPISRKDIANELGLTPAAVTLICADFINRGFIVERGEVSEENRAGRRKVLLDINYEYKHIIGINIDGEETYTSLCDLRGRAKKIKHFSNDYDLCTKKYLDKVVRCCKSMLDESLVFEEQILGVGVGLPEELVENDSRYKNGASGDDSQNQGKIGVIQKYLADEFKTPVYIDNSINALALGELLFGADKEKDSMLFVRWGDEITSTAVIDNKIYEGRNNKAVRLAHYIIEPNGRECSCGRKGCLSTRVSFDAIKNDVRKIFSKEKTPFLYEQLEGDKSRLDAHPAEWLSKMQDVEVDRIIREDITCFASALVNTATILDTGKIVLCGKLFRIPEMRKRLIDSCKKLAPDFDERCLILANMEKKESYIGPVGLVLHEGLFGCIDSQIE